MHEQKQPQQAKTIDRIRDFAKALEALERGTSGQTTQGKEVQWITAGNHPELLEAFGRLMRQVGAPPQDGRPGPVQKAVQRLAAVLVQNSGIDITEFFDRAHAADINARRAKFEAKLVRDDQPTKQGK